MEIAKVIKKRDKIEVGDVVLSKSGKYYLLVHLKDAEFPYTYIDLRTTMNKNGWKTLGGLNEDRYVVTDDIIIDIYKADNLRLELEIDIK